MGSEAAGRRWWVPYFGVLFVVLELAAVVGRAGYELKDPGVGWHLRTGRLILDTGAIPRTDPFSFTAAGREWLNYYWAFEVASAWLERVGGLPLVSAVWMLVYGLIPFLLYRWMIRAGASPLAVLLALPFAQLVLLSHAIARPHVATYLFFTILVARLDDVRTGRRGARALWPLPLMAAAWANLHGGFISGLAATGIVAGACALRWIVHREPADGRHAVAFGTVLAAMFLATLANPYGFRLHVQAIEHLSLPSTGYFLEFLSPNFRDGLAAVRYFEVLILALLGVTALGWISLAWAELALVVAMLHAALTAVRNMNLFAIVAVPLIARGLTTPLAAQWPRLVARWSAIAAEQERAAGWRVQLPAVAVVVLALTLAGRLPWLTSLDGLQLTRGAAAYVDEHPEQLQRAFNTDGLGGSLIHRFWPRLRVFVDDRTVVYGEDFIMNDYFTVFYGRDGWEAVLDRWGITSAIVSTASRSATVLRDSPSWTVVYEDERNLILSRSGRSARRDGDALPGDGAFSGAPALSGAPPT